MVESGTTPKLPDQRLEINAKHPIIKHLATLRESDADFAAVVARQLFSNALISAGLLDDPRTMLADLNQMVSLVQRGCGSAVQQCGDKEVEVDVDELDNETFNKVMSWAQQKTKANE